MNKSNIPSGSNGPEKEKGPQDIELVNTLTNGIPYDRLSDTQKRLWNKLDHDQRKELSQKVRINFQSKQIEFPDINMAIYTDDLLLDKTKKDDLLLKKDYKRAIAKCTELGKARDLPAERSFTNPKESQSFKPEDSAYDKIINYLPGNTELDKAENFSLLTGMDGFYWTKGRAKTDDGKVAYIYRQFSPGTNAKDRGWDLDYVGQTVADIKIRPVKQFKSTETRLKKIVTKLSKNLKSILSIEGKQ